MRKIAYVVAAAALVLGGCAAKKSVEAPSVLKPDRRYLEALRHTQRGDISVSLENKAQIIATYLNPLDERRYKDAEAFFVRIYIDNDFEDENRSGLFNPYYRLTLNGDEPKKIQKIEYDEAAAMDMPFVKKWYKLYIVEFNASQKRNLDLKLTHPEFGSAVLRFRNSDAY